MPRKKMIGLTTSFALTAMLTTTALPAFANTTEPYNVLSQENSKTVESGTNWVVETTTKLSVLTIVEGGTISAPEGYNVTLTVNGIGKTIKPGTYRGNIVITVSKWNVIKYVREMMGVDLTHYYRQALFVDQTGIVPDKSVTASVVGGKVSGTKAKNIKITSEEESYNGVYVTGGKYTIEGAKINLTGNGGNDFAGFGAGIMSTGQDTTLVVDQSEVHSKGAARSAIVADNGSNMIVKNSKITTENGTLPEDYQPNVTLGLMKSAPWMLGIVGNNRATNLLGENTTSTYINSSIESEGWGSLSTDDGENVKLTAINSHISITGESGYGAYAIGGATDSFYGSKITVPDYALILAGGSSFFGASSRENVAKLNVSLKLGLTDKELQSLTEQQTTIKSKRFGIMWHSNGGSVNIEDGTIFDTEKTTFLVKGAPASIHVDGSKGSQIQSGNRVILQLMDNDDPGPVMTDGMMLNTGIYQEPIGPAVKDDTHSLSSVMEDKDTVANFSNIELKGDFYNSTRGGIVTDFFGTRSGSKNLSVNFDHATITGVISSSSATHAISQIGASDFKQLGEVSNNVGPAVNNGVIVSLKNGSTWTITDQSYLTSLTIADHSKVEAPKGYKVTMIVDGVETEIKAGTYEGDIVLTVKSD